MTITELINKYADEGLEQIILSKSTDKEFSKVKIRPVLLKKELKFQAEAFKGAQVFHENLSAEELAARVDEYLSGPLHQGEFHHKTADAIVLVSKNGTVTIKEKRKQPAKTQAVTNEPAEDTAFPVWQTPAHNREKRTLLPEGTPIPFMYDLGVFTMDGRVVKDKYDKYRQINRFLEFIEDVLPELPKDRTVNILDFGCGKSYLTFAIYYYLTELNHYDVHIIGLDLKKTVIENCSALAKKYGYTGLEFRCGDVADFKDDIKIDMMVTLHACDTATDYALHRAITCDAGVVLSVPCCQHELNAQIKSDTLEPLFKHGLIKERMAALITDALRAELLEENGYRVQMLEFIDMEHTPKNILIRAVKRNGSKSGRNVENSEKYDKICETLGVKPKLAELLKEDKR